MTVFEILVASVGIATPIAVFLWWATVKIRTLAEDTRKLLRMHEHPESTGFGTVGLEAVIRNNTHATKELIHYVKWMAQEQAGKIPPPFLGGADG